MEPEDPDPCAPIERHLVPRNWGEPIALLSMLQETLADKAWGNIYHSTGGAELDVRVQDHIAAYWPERTPRYE